MMSIIKILTWFLFIFLIAGWLGGDPKKKTKKSDGKSLNRIQNTPRHDNICSAAKVKKSGLNALGLEDRENDWLARQLKEEAKLKRKLYSDMAALKEEHLAAHGKN